MKTQFKHLFSALLVATLTGGMFTLSGCPEETDCTVDADCATGETCNTETSTCEVGGCADDAACTTAGELCFGEDEAAGTLGECRAPADCSEAANPNEFCNAATAGQVCNLTSKMCEVPAPTDEYRYILIKDVSTGAAACDSNPAAGGSDPGSDIMWAILNDGQGQEVGYGKSAKFEAGTSDGDANTYNKPETVLTGESPAIDADLCPAEVDNKRFRDDSVVALGCGGKLFVEFIGTDMMTTLVEDGFSVEVGEYAAFCNAAGGDPMGSDRYDVYLCRTEVGAMPTEADCATKLNTTSQGGILAPVTVNIAAE
jgi:hypothetical protein